MPLKHRAPSFSFNNLSNGSNARFQILLLSTPPWGVPQTGLIVLIPRTSAIEFLFLRKFIYHLIIKGGYLLSTRTFWIVLVAKLLKDPMISTDRTRQSWLLRMQLSIMFTNVDRAVSTFSTAICMLHIRDFAIVVWVFPEGPLYNLFHSFKNILRERWV